MKDLVDDWRAEHLALARALCGVDDEAWDAPTPSPRWRVRDQIGHLTFFDEQAAFAATDPQAFEMATRAALTDTASFMKSATAIGTTLAGTTLLNRWNDANLAAHAALLAVADGTRLPWFGPAMSARSFVTARLMETWAHGVDVIDGLTAVGVPAHRADTDRLRHICHLGAATRGWSYAIRNKATPHGEVRVELELPSGAHWSSGTPGAADRVSGTARAFCLVVTQRRNVTDTDLDVEGPGASEWMRIAQCFAGSASLPPEPGAFLLGR